MNKQKIYKDFKELFPDSEIVIMSKEEKEWWDKHNPFRVKLIRKHSKEVSNE